MREDCSGVVKKSGNNVIISIRTGTTRERTQSFIIGPTIQATLGWESRLKSVDAIALVRMLYPAVIHKTIEEKYPGVML